MRPAQVKRGTVAPSKTPVKAAQAVSPSRPLHAAWPRQALVLFLILAALSLLYCSLPLASVIKIGTDEDFALSKALLSFKGYKMYTDYWNDQPPLHTFLLKFIFSHVSFSVLAARWLTVLSALLLLGALFVLVLKSNGLLTASLATLLLIGSPGFLELSASAMVELPALAPVIAALCLLQLAPLKRGWLPEILAGLLFAVALQIKLIGALYLPLAALILWSRHRQSPHAFRSWVLSGLCFGAALIVGFLGVQFLTGEALTAQFAQSRASHFSITKSYEYGSPSDHPFVWSVLLKHWDTTVPALVGLLLMVRRRETQKWILPFSWLVLTFVVFTNYKPYWTYYYVHIAIPLCWWAAMGIAAAWHYSRNPKRLPAYGVVGAFAACALVWMTARVYLETSDIRNKPRTFASPVLAEIKRYKPYAPFFWASEPVYAFHVDMPIPPRIATLSLKRFWSGDMTNEKLVDDMKSLRPGIVLLTDDGRQIPFQSLLDSDYRLVYHDSQHRLYVLPAVIERADPWPSR